jgi:membrane protease YdiL (CAAX protease family)
MSSFVNIRCRNKFWKMRSHPIDQPPKTTTFLPLLSVPWWEEVLYRGFLCPALSLFMPVRASVFVSGVVFSAHHLSIVAGLHLAVLGWTWAAL